MSYDVSVPKTHIPENKDLTIQLLEARLEEQTERVAQVEKDKARNDRDYLALSAENSRLREVLQDIAIAKNCNGYSSVLGGKLMDMARIALQPRQEGTPSEHKPNSHIAPKDQEIRGMVNEMKRYCTIKLCDGIDKEAFITASKKAMEEAMASMLSRLNSPQEETEDG